MLSILDCGKSQFVEIPLRYNVIVLL